MKARRFTWRRGATMALAAGLMFALTGDRGRAAIPPGIDPLEVLNLQIRPNVMIVLDSSGSMQETIAGNDTTSGDAAFSKLRQAKVVLSQVIQQNETKASFLFGQYTEANSSLLASGLTRFVYSTTDPNANVGGTGMAFTAAFPVTITGTNNRVYYEEYVAGGVLLRTCSGTVATGGPYTTGATVATDLQTAMMGATCAPTARQNTYTVGTNGNGGFNVARSAGTRTFRILSPGGINPIASTLGFDNNTGTGTNFASDLRIVQRTGNYDPPDPVGGPVIPVRYQLRVRKFFNGQRINVSSAGTVCSVTPAATGGTGGAAFVEFRRNTTAGCGTSGPVVTFTFDGGNFNGNTVSCGGFQLDAPLTPCNQTTPTQLSVISPFIDTELLYNANNAGDCQVATCPIQGYREGPGGNGDFFYTGTTRSEPTPGGIRAVGSTPIIQSILDIKGLAANIAANPARPQRNFAELWFNGNGPVQAISLHNDPKEETILIFVTDGDATCATVTGTGATADRLALGAAFAAEQLYRRLDPAEFASGVTTYLVTYGSGAQATRSNWIAWGGSGMTTSMVAAMNTNGVGAVDDNACTSITPGACATAATIPAGPTTPPLPGAGSEFIRWAIGPDGNQKAAFCPTCIDAVPAPDAATLAAVLDAIINQGATTGEFSAQQSITGVVYEYVNLIAATPPAGTAAFDPANPGSRYAGFVPTKILSTFDLPGFKGQLKAFTDTEPADGVAELRWSAGDKLLLSVQAGMGAQCAAAQCTFGQLHGGATDSTIEASSAGIKRRIYTTSQNGYFGLGTAELIASQSPFRVPLWPPTQFNVAPPTGPGLFDTEMGLTSANYPTTADYQTAFHACKGNWVGGGPGPVDDPGSGHPCSSADPVLQYETATKEAREMLLAFAAGAQFVKDGNGDPVRSAVGPLGVLGQILYEPRPWILAESTLSTPVVVSPPLPVETSLPATHQAEYKNYVDGPRDAANVNTTGTAGIRAGFGLRNPDKDSLTPLGGSPPVLQPDSRTNLKPVMTVVYAGSNAVLHAFRAGPCTAFAPTCTETGGEELWAFEPYDELDNLRQRYLNDPQTRDPHDYAIAASLRFGDVYVPEDPANPGGSATPPTLTTIGGIAINGNGVWRKVLYFGRGIGGKYVTAIDVTAPGLYLETALSTTGPLVLWNRGNPDTVNGPTGGGGPVNGPDTVPYSKMGQTWSVPAIGFVAVANNTTTRRPAGVEFVLYMGSGFSDVTGEGTTFYTLDALTGDVIGAPDTETTSTTPSMLRNLPFPNALVANPASFVGDRFQIGKSVHPAGALTTRVYFGDIHGRVWKLLSAFPNELLPVADLGPLASNDIDELQPAGSAVSLLGLPGSPAGAAKPYVFVETGNDNRVADTTTFKMFAFRDNGTETDNGPYTGISTGGITVFPTSELLFQDVFPSRFRGTVQPAAGFADGAGINGIVFYGGTRFNPAGSAEAPPPFPCRSSFDSVVFGLDATTGTAAFDLGGGAGNDSYVMFQDSRLIGLSIIGDPTNPTGQRLNYDEGLRKPNVPETPPPMSGVPTPTTAASNSVSYSILPNSPLPMVRLGSTVCQ